MSKEEGRRLGRHEREAGLEQRVLVDVPEIHKWQLLGQ
jgi:hypothetical protein